MASKATIGGKIVLEGEAEYRSALRNINQEQKELRSEMKLCNSEFRDSQNSLEALTRKHAVLEKQIGSQADRIRLYENQLQKAKDAEDEAAKKVESLKSRLESAKKEYDEMSEASGTTTEALDDQKKIIDDLSAELAKAEQSYENAGYKVGQYGISLNNAQADMNDLQATLANTERYMEEASQSADGCAVSIDEYGKKVKKVAETTSDTTEESQAFGDKTSAAVNQVAEALAAAGIAKAVKEIAEALKECADESAKYETATAKLSTIADTNSVSIQSLRNDILAASSDLGVFAEDLSDVTYNAISSGVETAGAVNVAVDSAKLATAGFTDTSSALSVLTTAMNSYNISAEDAVLISDSLIQTQNLGVLTIDGLSNSMGKAISTASAYSVDLYNLEAGYISLTKAGISVDESTTYMSGMFSELGKSGSKVATVLREKTGKSFGELMKSGYSLSDVLGILLDSVNGNSEALMNLWGSQEAGKAANAIVNQGLETFNENLESVRNSAGATEEAFNAMADTTEQAKNRMDVAFQNLKITIGDELRPALNQVYESGQNLAEFAAGFVQDHPEIVQAVVALTAGLAAFTVGITAAKVGMMAFNAVMNTNPVVLATTAVIALTAALATLTGAATAYTAEMKSQVSTSQDSINALKGEIENRRRASGEMENNAAVIGQLSSQIEALNSKEKLSNEEKAKMSSLVGQLNSAIPDLNLQIDEQTGLLEMNNEEFEDLISNQKDYLIMMAAQEDLAEITREQYEAMKQKTEIEEQMHELELEITDDTVQMHEAMEIFYQDMYQNGTAVADFSFLMYDQIDAYAAYQDQLDEVNGVLEGLDEEYAAAAEVAKGFTSAIEENTLVTVAYGPAVYQVTADVAESMQTLQTAYDEARQAAYDSITQQVGLFDELSVKSDLTVSQMATNLQTQADTYNQYASDLQMAAQLMEEDTTGSFSAIVQAIIEMGVDGSGYLHELVTAAGESEEDFNAVMVAFAEMNDAKSTLASTMADIETDYDKGMKELVSSTEAGTTDIAGAITAGTPDVSLAQQALCSNGIIGSTNQMLGIGGDGSSSVMKSKGAAVDQGIADGITASQGVIQSALQRTLDASIRNANFSGIALRINQILGDQLS